MKAVIQRVRRASVSVEEKEVAAIEKGLLVLVGFNKSDRENQCEAFIDKIIKMRIFEDSAGKMNLSVREVGGSVLLVPQFTLYANTQKGNRPSFDEAATPDEGLKLFEHLSRIAKLIDVPIKTGVFQAYMKVELVNDGPVTIILER